MSDDRINLYHARILFAELRRRIQLFLLLVDVLLAEANHSHALSFIRSNHRTF